MDFFTDPIKMFVNERHIYQQRYIKFLHEGISFALLDNNVMLARRLHKIKVPPRFEEVVKERNDECVVRYMQLPDNMYGEYNRCMYMVH